MKANEVLVKLVSCFGLKDRGFGRVRASCFRELRSG